MRFSALFTVGLSAIAVAMPTVTKPAASLKVREPLPIERREDLVTAIEGVLDGVSQSLVSTVDEVVAALGLTAVDDDVDSLLSGLVGGVDSLVDEIDDGVDGLLEDLGLGGLVTTIDDLETALGLSTTDTIGTLLTDLGIL
ncbi:hypothetical protein LTR85_006127 [Meristemomyces frigidus]|nr:hypothetical protein LTR85_006127 [Meristemomyces frigidus]